jgi:hypothetical protein
MTNIGRRRIFDVERRMHYRAAGAQEAVGFAQVILQRASNNCVSSVIFRSQKQHAIRRFIWRGPCRDLIRSWRRYIVPSCWAAAQDANGMVG